MHIQTQLMLRKKTYKKLEDIDEELKNLVSNYYKTLATLLPTAKPTRREIKAIASHEGTVSLDSVRKRLKHVRSRN
jgi:hypothetical protein